MNIDSAIQAAAVGFPAFLFAICFHEFSHGWVAHLRGDNTAKLMGRLTLNPMAHADVLGTLILPLIGFLFPGAIFFGWAKPVPVNYRNLANPRSDLFWIAIAGPLSNVILGFAGFGLWYLSQFYGWSPFIQRFATDFVRINASLAVFNMIPLHPLDGGKVLARFLPESINRKLEDHEGTLGLVLMMLIFTGGIGFLLHPPFRGLIYVYNLAWSGLMNMWIG